MAKKFIPNGDGDFLTVAQTFAQTLAKEPARFGVSAAGCHRLVREPGPDTLA